MWILIGSFIISLISSLIITKNIIPFFKRNKIIALDLHKKEKLLELSERQRNIIKYLKDNDRITTRICANILDVSNDTALRELSKLKSKDIIKQIGIGRGIYYVLK